MSALFPRHRFLPPPAPPAEPIIQELPLPPLKCGIFDEAGKLVKVVEMPDPRLAFCRQWSYWSDDFGLTARPIVGGEGVGNG
jgi:hypothetical protein